MYICYDIKYVYLLYCETLWCVLQNCGGLDGGGVVRWSGLSPAWIEGFPSIRLIQRIRLINKKLLGRTWSWSEVLSLLKNISQMLHLLFIYPQSSLWRWLKNYTAKSLFLPYQSFYSMNYPNLLRKEVVFIIMFLYFE